MESTISQEQVTSAIRDVFVALADEAAFNFPVVRDKLDYKDAIFGFKSGFDRSGPTLAVKAGGLWPANRAAGLPNHQSTIVLFDSDTGGPHALVRGTYLTALRTAAASALSIRALAREDVTTLGLIGAGGQAPFQIRAALQEREFSRVIVHDADEAATTSLVASLSDLPVECFALGPRELCEQSDVIITVTPSREPFIQSDWVCPGTHIACMGADTKGKHEVAIDLVVRSHLFCDEADQATTIGECQHAYGAGLIDLSALTPLGDVLRGAAEGRTSDSAITLFDSTGMGLQDLAAANMALEVAMREGLAKQLDE
ncbi:MAG: ornithine cyclodeaminase family protein [Pseudomonadota bacterium]